MDVAAQGPFAVPRLRPHYAASKSGVARVSLAARHRWEVALWKVLVMGKVARAFSQASM